MKIVIDINDVEDVGLSPSSIYRALYMEYWEKLKQVYSNHLWNMAASCDLVARELFARKTGRAKNVKNLILTYKDAEECFELFKQFADVWAGNVMR